MWIPKEENFLFIGPLRSPNHCGGQRYVLCQSAPARLRHSSVRGLKNKPHTVSVYWSHRKADSKYKISSEDGVPELKVPAVELCTPPPTPKKSKSASAKLFVTVVK